MFKFLICRCKFSSTVCNSDQIRNNNTKSQSECKIIVRADKNYSRNPSTYISENSKYLESAADDSKIKCKQIIMWKMMCQQIFRTKMSVTVTVTVLVITLLFIIAIVC